MDTENIAVIREGKTTKVFRNLKPKNLSRGIIDEATETHPALEMAANDGKMFAITLGQVAKLQDMDDEKIADLLTANLLPLRSPLEVKQKLLNRLQDSSFKQDLIKGFALMSESVKSEALPNDKPIRLCIVVEDENLPTIVFKDVYNNLIAHSGGGQKTDMPYTSIYAGYNSVKTAIDNHQEDGFQEIIAHEARDIIRGYHVDESMEASTKFYGDTINKSMLDKPVADLPIAQFSRAYENFEDASSKEAVEERIRFIESLNLSNIPLNFANVRLPDSLITQDNDFHNLRNMETLVQYLIKQFVMNGVHVKNDINKSHPLKLDILITPNRDLTVEVTTPGATMDFEKASAYQFSTLPTRIPGVGGRGIALYCITSYFNQWGIGKLEVCSGENKWEIAKDIIKKSTIPFKEGVSVLFSIPSNYLWKQGANVAVLAKDRKEQAVLKEGGYHIDEETEQITTLYNDILDIYDAGEFKILWFDVLDKAFQEEGIYKIKYDTSRLTNSQIAIIREYVRLLNDKTQGKFEAVGCSSRNGSKETLITVYRQDKAGNTIGKGCVDIDIPANDSIEQYALRITGMLNMALAASNIEENLPDEVNAPIAGFIKRQCQLMVGGNVTIPENLVDLIKFIRNLPLPKASRIPAEKIEEYNKLAKEALIAA
jgi:hypothetical protein